MSGTLPRRWGSWLLVVLQRPTSAPSLPLAPVEVELEVVQPPLAWLVVRAEQEVQRGAGSVWCGPERSAGHRNPVFWRRMIANFFFNGLLLRSALIALQHATTFSSALVPPFATACRCSTLASAFCSDCLQKKQSPPCSKSKRSSCFMTRGGVACLTPAVGALLERGLRQHFARYR